MDLGIAGRRAAVAGASRGLGFATAAALVAEGVDVAICGRDPDRIAASAARIGARPVVADVSTVQGAQEFVASAEVALGGIDILVANSGGPPGGGIAAFPDAAAYTRAFEQSGAAMIAMCLAAVGPMRVRGWGRVLAVTSTSAREPLTGLVLSNVARAGLTAFLKTLATEVAPDGVTVNSLQPGFHATDRLAELGADLEAIASATPTRSVGRPEDFGRAAAFLCSDAARYITGVALPVDGGRLSGLQ
ncbi:MAG: SDR family oxidoreductase [Actinomycetes bacterium]